jgi:hypothetical protein
LGEKIQSKLRISQGVDDIFGMVFSIAGHLKKEVSLAEHVKTISVLCDLQHKFRCQKFTARMVSWFEIPLFFCTSLGLLTPKDHFEFDNC